MTTNNHPAHGPVSLDRLHQISEILSKAAAQSDGGNLGYAMADAVKVIAGVIASFGAEPVLYAMQGIKLDTDAVSTCKNVVDGWVDEWNQERKPGAAKYKTVSLYTAPSAPVVPNCEKVRREHAEWSDVTFGDVGPVGPLKHLSKEALEAAAEPGDLSEWADMQFLLWDAQRRAGISDEQITQAMVEKLAVNKQREWPEPKDGEPRLHIKEQPVLVATGATYSGFEDFWSACKHPFAQDDELKDVSWVIWNACRASMLQANYRDLSQPVDPQVAEYEEMMNQAGNHTEQRLDMVDNSGDANKMVAHWMPLPAAPQQEVTSARVHPARNK